MVYQQFEWTVDQRPQNPCLRLHRNFDEEYEVCQKATLPRANVGRFKLTRGQFKLDAFEKEYETTKEKSNYVSTCMGDSGSGQWVTVNRDSDDERRAVVAIVTTSATNGVRINGRLVDAVCGSSLIFSNGKTLSQGASSTKTTHPTMLTFIKKWAEI